MASSALSGSSAGLASEASNGIGSEGLAVAVAIGAHNGN